MTTQASFPIHISDSDSDDDNFQDAREILTSSDISLHDHPPPIPITYSRIENIPSPNPPLDNELSIFKLAKEILSNVKPGADVTNISLPASILDPVSILEKAKKSMQRGELLQDVCAANDPESRMLNILRFNFSGLAKERFGKKPYNPVLGEVYRCCFAHRGAAGETLLVAEQVSHHPPITALHLRNDTLGFRMNSYTAPQPRFWGNSLEVKLGGEIRIVLTNFDNEEYVITRPYMNMTGFLAGRQRLEFIGISKFLCEQTGLAAEVEYKGKGSLALRPDVNSIEGRVYNVHTGHTMYTMEGHWDKKVTLTHVETNQQRVLFDYDTVFAEMSMAAICPPPEEEEASFSTRIWEHCSKAVQLGDSIAANAEKRKVEDHQRRLRKQRAAEGIEWRHHYFLKAEDGNGYVLRPDLGDNLAKLSLRPEEISALRSGELMKGMHQEMASSTDSMEAKGKHSGRRKFLPRASRKV